MFAKKGKAKNGKIGNELPEGDKKDLSETYEGSLSNKYFIIITLKDGSQKKGKILSCRLSKSNNPIKILFAIDGYFRNEKQNIKVQIAIIF